MDLTEKKNKLMQHGTFYHDTINWNASTYKFRKSQKKFVWMKNETWGDFIDRCFDFLNRKIGDGQLSKNTG